MSEAPGFFLFNYDTHGRSPLQRELRSCERIAEGFISGTLYEFEDVRPALMLYGDAPVRGAIWRCPAGMLPAMDAAAGVAQGRYRRVATNVRMDSSSGDEVAPCWLYVAGPKLAPLLTPDARVRPAQP
jgi:hypothetical protein